MNHYTHQALFKQMEQWASKELAYDWDPIGLQAGNELDTTKKVLITLDVTNEVVDEAIAKGVNLIIAHHPLFFKPMQHISTSTAKGKIIQKVMQHNITVYAAHTNLDIAKGGVNDLFSEALDLKNVRPLIQTKAEKLYKLIVYVPMEHVEQMRGALSQNGAGHIGDYSHCTFQTEGQGTFKPLEGTDPFIGSTNQLEKVQESKLETIVKENDLSTIIKTMKKAHPYEEVAYDLFALHQTGTAYGLGRIGNLKNSVTLHKFSKFVKAALEIDHLRFIGDPQKDIHKVAVLGGSGEKYIRAAIKSDADVLVTGDITFHAAQDALEDGFALIDAGHYSEKIMKRATKSYLKTHFPELDMIISSVHTDPFQFL